MPEAPPETIPAAPIEPAAAPPDSRGDIVVEIDDVNFSYDRKKDVLRDITMPAWPASGKRMGSQGWHDDSRTQDKT